MIANASSKRETRLSYGMPNASNSRRFQPDAEPEHEAPAADLVDRRRHLRQHARRVEARAGHERPEPHALGHRRERAQQRERLPRRALRLVIEQVVAEPDRLEPDLLGRPRHREVLGPAHVALDLGELDADAHRRDEPR